MTPMALEKGLHPRLSLIGGEAGTGHDVPYGGFAVQPTQRRHDVVLIFGEGQ